MKNEKIFDMMLNKALEEEVLAEAEIYAEEHEFSDIHNKKMEKLFKAERRTLRAKNAVKYARRAVCVVLAVFIVSGISIFSVEAWRAQFLNFVFNSEAPYTVFEFGEEKNFYDDGKISIGYLPLDFELAESDSNSKREFRCFVKSEKYIQITKSTIGGRMILDTEDGTIEKIKVQGYNAVYTSNPNINAIVWNSAHYKYTIAGNVSKEEILKIAESLK